MATLDDEIDHLYQRPLAEFTKARDELAKRFPSDKAAIKQLQKPNAAAWAVNQLYWRERGSYEALVSASSKSRAAQLASLKGKAADTAAAEARRVAARKAALDRIREIAGGGGDALSPAALAAVSGTLDALPTDDPPGRLVRPLQPMGFEGLAGMLEGKTTAPRAAQRRRAAVVPFRKKSSPAAEKRDAAERRKEIEKLASLVREAKESERKALAEKARAQKALDAAKAARERAVEELDRATEALGAATRELDARERIAVMTTSGREAFERQLALKRHDGG